MTEIKCMQDAVSSGALEVLVRWRTSLVEMLPTTFCPLSTMATLVRPSSFINIKASASGASELRHC